MRNVSERIEHLICRRLDGELTADERLELDRELLRCPDARQLLEDYERVDRLASHAIETAVRPAAADAPLRLAGTRRPAGWRPNWMLLTSAVAACIAFVLFWSTPEQQRQDDQQRPGPVAVSPTPAHVAPGGKNLPRVGSNWDDVGVWRVNDRPQRVNRVTDRKYLVLTGEDGRVYVVPVDHVREIQRDDLKQDELVDYDPI
jgi:anti-sigma factor RsiW